MAEKKQFRSIKPLYQKSEPVYANEVDPFRLLSILKLSRGPIEKADLIQMLDSTLEEVDKAVTTLAGKGIIKIEPAERPEKDVVSL